MGQKTDHFKKRMTPVYNDIEGVQYSTMFNSLSGVRFVF